MRKYVALFCVLAIIMMGVPAGSTNAMAKFGPALIDTSMIDPIHVKSDYLPVLIRLQTPCVVQQVTFGGEFTTSTQEINNPENLLRSTALSAVLMEQKNAIKTLVEEIDGLKITSSYQITSNVLRATIPRESLEDIAEFEFVTKIFYEKPLELHRWAQRDALNCWPVYNGDTDLDGDVCLDPKGREVNGKGIVCAVTDTGLDYMHPDFGSQSKPEGNKVIISHDFATSGDDCREDGHYHGTACAGIIAGDGPGQHKGIAPKALLAGYKIGKNGRLSGDVGKSWDLLVQEEIDVNNNSWGHAYGYTRFREPENNAVLAGVSIVASQGNSGSPSPMLPIPCGSTSSPENVIGVGAVTDYATASKVIISDTQDIDSIGKEFKGIWGDTGKEFKDFGRSIQIVDCGWGREQDFRGIDVEGKIALVRRGPNAENSKKFGNPLNFSEKLLRSAENGAVMMLLYNHSPGFFGTYYKNVSPQQMESFIPSFEALMEYGLYFQNLLHSGHEWEFGQPDKNQNEVYVKVTKPILYANLTTFTSSGPSQYANLKPDISAPGHSVETSTAESQWERTGSKYTQSFNGTSAAGPFVAGVVCLIRQARPEWHPLEVKRAIMNTANLLTRYADDSYIPLLSQGLGEIDAFNACMTDVMIQPPSALIVASNKYIKMDDIPEEWNDKVKKAKLPREVKKSMIPLKLYNYNDKDAHTVELSYEVNSRQADEIEVTFTSDTVTIPPGERDDPNSVIIGMDIDFPSRLTGGTNDVIVWFTDKKTGQKWHIAVCIYNNHPSIQGLRHNFGASYLNYSNPTITPNGDGITDGFDVDFTISNGSPNFYTGESDNFLDAPGFLIADYNDDIWSMLDKWSVLELGEHKFSWDGLDSDGEYFLPDGEWYLGMGFYGYTYVISGGRYVKTPLNLYSVYNRNPFQVKDSIVPPLPLISAYPIPATPGKGSEFELGIYIQHATNIKSIQFKVVLPGLSDIAKFMGGRAGEFMMRDTEFRTSSPDGSKMAPLVTIEHDDGSDKIWIDIQRPLDGVSGEGWLAYLRLLPTASNYLDITFENLNISYINEETMAEEYKFAFYKSTSVTIERDFFDPADFNHDGNIDYDDLDILTSILGSLRGEDNFNWRCDLDYNGVIDMHDMTIFAQAME